MYRFSAKAGHRTCIIEQARDDADATRQVRAYWPNLPANAEIAVHKLGVAPGFKETDGEVLAAGAAPDDPTLAELGLDEDAAEPLERAGLKTRSAILAYAKQHGSLLPVDGIGPVREQDIRAALAAYRRKE